jgi:hypothetical protein
LLQQTRSFEKLASDKSNITFNNKLVESKHLYYRLPYYYNGGGALGDVNNDGLVDVYFTSNQGKINYTSIKAGINLKISRVKPELKARVTGMQEL